MKRLLAAGFAALAAIAAIQGAAAQTTLRFGKIPSTVRNVGSLYLHVAERKGFFTRQGIKFESVLIEGGTDRMVSAIDAGKVDLAHSSTPYLIAAVLKGSNAIGIAGEVGNPVYTLIVRPEIASYADLRGKVIALSVAADTISITTRKLLAKNGVKDGEFKVRQLVGTPSVSPASRAASAPAFRSGSRPTSKRSRTASAGWATPPRRWATSSSSSSLRTGPGLPPTPIRWFRSCARSPMHSALSVIPQTATTRSS